MKGIFILFGNLRYDYFQILKLTHFQIEFIS